MRDSRYRDLNFKVRPEFAREFKGMAGFRGHKLKEFIEIIYEHYKNTVIVLERENAPR